jgi:hypothetical protein
MKRPLNPSRPRLSVTTGRDLLPVLEGLAMSDTRTASQMARRLITEALDSRGLWDLENNWPTRDARRRSTSNVVTIPRPWHR